MLSDSHLVFCYGSLKRGFGNHHILEGAEFVEEYVTSPEYTMVSFGGFPAVTRAPGLAPATSIAGELYRVSPTTLARLDRLESYPDFYQKESITTKHGLATMYVIEKLDVSKYKIVEDGVWRGYNSLIKW